MSRNKLPIAILIVDDHPLVRESIAALLSQERDFAVCGEAQDAQEALPLIAKTKPDIVILDLQLKSGDGLEVVKLITESSPETKVLVFSGHDEFVYALRVVRAGASGFVGKAEPSENFIAALRTVANGGVALSEAVRNGVLNSVVKGKAAVAHASVESLTDRELQIFTLFGQGMRARAIAEHLHLSLKTVETHRANMKEKLNLPTAATFLRCAIEWVKDEKTKLG